MTNSELFDFIQNTIKELLPDHNENVDALAEALYALDRNKIYTLDNKESIKSLLDKKFNGIGKLLRSDKLKSEIETKLYELLLNANPNMTSDKNIVKRTCKELGITQKELADRLGVSKPSVDRWASTGEIPDSSKKLINFLLENEKLKNELKELKEALKVLHKHSL